MVLWMLLHLGSLMSIQSGAIRFFLTLIFSLAILLRPKPDGGERLHPAVLLTAALAGAHEHEDRYADPNR